jgi:hypothetical protein
MSLSKQWKPWTDEEKEKVLSMANDPFTKYSLDQITAEVPGRTRDAVQGVISRGKKKTDQPSTITHTTRKRKQPIGSEKGVKCII